MTMANWIWTAGDPSSGVGTVELNRARSRKLKFRLDAPAEAGFQLDGRSEVAGSVIELRSDVWARRDGTLLFRGRVQSTNDDLDANAHTVQVSALDYRSILERRQLYDGDAALQHVNVDQAQIAWLLISATQARTGGALGITQGTNGFTAGSGSTGQLRSRTYQPGAWIGQLLKDLGNVQNGFDWEIDSALKLQVYYPSRGTAAGRKLDYGGALTKVRRSFTPKSFANAVRAQAGPTLTPETRETAGLSTDARGRWEEGLSYSQDIVFQTTLAGKADAAIAELSRSSYGWTVTWRNGAWGGPSDVWLGDTVQLLIDSPPRLARVNVSCRVQEVDLAISEAGEESVAMTLEQLS